MMERAGFTLLALLLGAPASRAADTPSRPAGKNCAWEKLSDEKLGLEAWVQRCDYGSRKIDLVTKGGSLVERYSDSPVPEPVVDVFDLLPDETPEAGVKRLFTVRTDSGLAARCVMVPYRGEGTPRGVKRYTFVPNSDYEKELRKKADPQSVPDPACGDWGDAPDGIQYFETQPASRSRKVLFVRVGQDEPLFDEKTLKLLPQH